jgi:predicted nucleotidyltransferase
MGVSYLAIFGSVARGDAGLDSDIDILVELQRPAGLLKYARLQNYLAGLLGRKVDLVSRSDVRPELRERVTAESVRVL